MSVIASCGHMLAEEEDLGTTIAIHECTKKGEPCIAYLTVCNMCRKWYKDADLIIAEKL